MSNKGLWIVYDSVDGAEVFDNYDKAFDYYEKCKEEIEDAGADGIDPDDTIYLAKVDRHATWKEDKDRPIYKTDEFGDYYWVLAEERDSDE